MNHTFKYLGCEYELRVRGGETGYVYQIFRNEHGRKIREVQLCSALKPTGNALRATEKNFEAVIKKHAYIK